MRENQALRELLDRRGLRYDAFARRLGLSPSRLNHILAGRRPAPPSFYQMAALALGVEPEEITPAVEQEPVAAA